MYASHMYTCIHVSGSRIKGQIYMHHTCMYQDPTPRIALFVRSLVRSLVRYRKISHHRYMHHTYMQASGSRSRIINMCIIYTYIRVKVQDHRYVHHSHMHQSQGSRNIDKCIIHGFIRIMDKCIIGMCIMVTCIRAKNMCIAHAVSYTHLRAHET